MLSFMFSRAMLHLVLLAVAGFLAIVMLAARQDTSDFRPRELSSRGSAAVGMYIQPARLARQLQYKYRKSSPELADLQTVCNTWLDGIKSGRLGDCRSEGRGDHSLDGAKAQIFNLRQYLTNCMAAHARHEFQAGRAAEGVTMLQTCFKLTRALEHADLRTFAATLSERNRFFRNFGPYLSELPLAEQNKLLAFAPTQTDARQLSTHLHEWVEIVGILPEDNLAGLYSKLGKLVSNPDTKVADIDAALARTMSRPRENANWLFVGKIAWTNIAEMRENTAAIRNRAFSPTPNLDYRALMSSSATK